MATYIYRRNSSASARSLADAVEGRRWRRAAPPSPLRAGDIVVCWGEEAPVVPAGVHVINGGALRNKFTDATVLREAGVRTIEVSRTRPAPIAAVATTDTALALWEAAQNLAGDFVEIETFSRTPVMVTGLNQLAAAITNLRQSLERPAPIATPARPNGEWVGRMNNHIGGNDLLAPPATPDYFSRKLDLVREYRVHSFDGRSIRAGRKELRDGFALATPHPQTGTPTVQTASPWIRSFDGGWRIVYDSFESTQPMRALAAAACTALGLVFGAVDIGETRDGNLVVLEVNRAPGLEGNSLTSYGTALTRWISEHGSAEARRNAA